MGHRSIFFIKILEELLFYKKNQEPPISKKKKKMLRLQYFYNKSQMVNYYLFKFETNTKITILP